MASSITALFANLPEGWDIRSLESIATKIRAGGTPSRSKRDYWNGEIPFAKIDDITRSGGFLTSTSEAITEAGLASSSAWVVPPGAVVLTMYGTIGAAALVGIPVATNQAIIALLPISGVDSTYLLYALTFWGPELRRLNVQSTQKNVNAGIVRQFPIPIPPLPEQRAIAHVLRTVQQARDRTEQVIAAARVLKRSLMAHLFTHGAHPGDLSANEVGRVITELGPLPSDWTVLSLSEVQAQAKYAITSGPFGSKLGRKDYQPRGVPVLRGGNLVGGRDIILDDLVYVSEEKADELASCIARPGDVVVTQRGSLGQAAFIPDGLPFERYVVSQSQMKFTANGSKVLPEFVLYALQTDDSLRRIQDSAIRSGVPHINLSMFRAFRIPLPPIPQQEAIVHSLDAANQKMNAEERGWSALEGLFKSLLHDLMTAQLRVDQIASRFA